MTTHIALAGGTRHGMTLVDRGLDDDLRLLFDTPSEPEEMYERTDRTLTIDGIEHTVYRLVLPH